MAELRERIALRFKRHCTCCDGWPEGETCATCREEAGVVIGLVAKSVRERAERAEAVEDFPKHGADMRADELRRLADEMEGR